MNWVDLAIILFVFLFALEGQKRGFLVQLFDILGFFVSLIASLTLYSQAASFFLKVFTLPQIAANPVGFLFVWLITETVFFTVFANIFTKVFQTNATKPINKFFGFIPAVINALLFLAFVLLFVVSLPINPAIKLDVFNSKIGSVLLDKATVLERPFNNIFGPITKRGLTFFTVKNDEKECQSLGFTQTQISIDYAGEKQMFDLINKERAKAGAKPLEWEGEIADAARNHSKDMFARNYFCHYSPEGLDVGDRLENDGIEYTAAGENLAYAPDVTRAHNGLMNSPGHKRNILDPAFKRIGIGTIDGGVYGKIFTQVFTN